MESNVIFAFMKGEYFTLGNDQKGTLTLEFKKSHHASTFTRMEFLSRLLHSLKPDQFRIWREGDRMDAEIVGWPKDIVWTRTSEKTFSGSTKMSPKEVEQYTQILETALARLIAGGRDANGNKTYEFGIRKNGKLHEYSFRGRGRVIAALCVLYDLEPHPRNDLEINIPKSIAQKEWPVSADAEVQRTYGDPSKTADELRNEGWSRMGDKPGMEVSRDSIEGQIQQTYRLLREEQDLGTQMQRSNIPKKWRKALYESQNYTCQICLHQYDETLLEPDHRIPVIYKADALTEENFLQKLMTLCRFCNQQKRETTKRLPANYDWANSAWAYPEKFDLDIIKQRLIVYKNRSGKTINELAHEINSILDSLDK